MSDSGGGKISLAVCKLGSAKDRTLRVAGFLIRYGEGFSDGLETEGRLKFQTALSVFGHCKNSLHILLEFSNMHSQKEFYYVVKNFRSLLRKPHDVF